MPQKLTTALHVHAALVARENLKHMQEIVETYKESLDSNLMQIGEGTIPMIRLAITGQKWMESMGAVADELDPVFADNTEEGCKVTLNMYRELAEARNAAIKAQASEKSA